jgi:hypothetical protein
MGAEDDASTTARFTGDSDAKSGRRLGSAITVTPKAEAPPYWMLRLSTRISRAPCS